jgi:trans-aconitate 2-methyltransferase
LTWSAEQYVAFEAERTRPVRDLLAALPPIDARSLIDLGCGPGNSTEVLTACYPRAKAAGIDGSAEMIAAARRRLPQVRFTVEDLQAWIESDPPEDGSPFDVILANAVLQWVPGHAALLPKLVARLAPNGALAVQMPDNLGEPAHELMREVAGGGPWAVKLAASAAARPPLAGAAWYYELLRPLCRVDLWRTTYYHFLPGGAQAVVEWFKGSGLRPFLEPLNAAERGAFLDRYTAALARAYPAAADGGVMLPFPRIFLTAIR